MEDCDRRGEENIDLIPINKRSLRVFRVKELRVLRWKAIREGFRNDDKDPVGYGTNPIRALSALFDEEATLTHKED